MQEVGMTKISKTFIGHLQSQDFGAPNQETDTSEMIPDTTPEMVKEVNQGTGPNQSQHSIANEVLRNTKCQTNMKLK